MAEEIDEVRKKIGIEVYVRSHKPITEENEAGLKRLFFRFLSSEEVLGYIHDLIPIKIRIDLCRITPEGYVEKLCDVPEYIS